MDYRWEGAGDLQNDDGEVHDFRPNSNYVRRKLRNGLPVPFFARGPDANGNNEEQDHNSPHASTMDLRTVSAPTERNRKKSLQDVIKEYLSCPICKDPCIEATSTNCGHKFCKDCLVNWRKEKPLCPICSTLITYSHRVYSDDQMIETQLENFSPKVQERYISAKKDRLDALLKERESQTVLKRINRKWDDSVIFLRCKNRATILAGLISKLEQFCNFMREWLNNYNHGALLGFFLGAMFIIVWNCIWNSINTAFFGYIYLAAKNYDGTIPKSWLEPNSGGMNMEEQILAGHDGEESYLEKLILDKIWWF